jgi:hypothetical protein
MNNTPYAETLLFATAHCDHRAIKVDGRRQPLKFKLVKRPRLIEQKPMQTPGGPVAVDETAGLS